MHKRKSFYVQTRYEIIRVCTTCEAVALQLAEIVMGYSHGPFEIVAPNDEPRSKWLREEL